MAWEIRCAGTREESGRSIVRAIDGVMVLLLLLLVRTQHLCIPINMHLNLFLYYYHNYFKCGWAQYKGYMPPAHRLRSEADPDRHHQQGHHHPHTYQKLAVNISHGLSLRFGSAHACLPCKKKKKENKPMQLTCVGQLSRKSGLRRKPCPLERCD